MVTSLRLNKWILPLADFDSELKGPEYLGLCPCGNFAVVEKMDVGTERGDGDVRFEHR